jgi:sterol desaturase/sphingolipid hydroxylase (fatty acid hydroxylase superfamily)
MPMDLLLHLLAGVGVSGLCFVAVCALIFWPLEELFEGDGAARPKLKDLAALWFYQSFGLWLAAGIIYEIAFFLRQFLPQPWLLLVGRQPFWLQATAALLMAEVWVYVFHRLSHTLPCLWKFHRVHHTLVDMTWSATSRQHPVDFLLIIVGANLPAMLLGVDLRPIAFLVVVERIYTVLLHSNLNLEYGWLTQIIASPRLHRLHHTSKCGNRNYAGILSLLDVLGNTFQPPMTKEQSGETHERFPALADEPTPIQSL